MNPIECIEVIKLVGEKRLIRGLRCILLLFRTTFNKFNNTRARILEFIFI